MKKKYEKPETTVISLTTEGAQMAAVSSNLNVSVASSDEVLIEDDSYIGAKVSKSLWDDDEE